MLTARVPVNVTARLRVNAAARQSQQAMHGGDEPLQLAATRVGHNAQAQ
jgi:hypothetical protein